MNVEKAATTKFLDLQTDNHLDWKHNIEQFIPQLSGACYAIRSMVYFSNINTLKSNVLCILSSDYKIWNNFWGLTLPMAGRFSLYKRKLSELWLKHNPELQAEVYLTTTHSTCSMSYVP